MARIRTSRWFGIGALALLGALAQGDPEFLVSMDFQGDVSGAVARGGTGFEVEEELYEAGATGAGVSHVEVAGSSHAFRIANGGSGSGQRALRAPLSSPDSASDLTLRAVVGASQVAAGGTIILCGPGEDPEWILRTSFGADGKFEVHGQSTNYSYTSGGTYSIVATLHRLPDGTGTADYQVTEVGNPTHVLNAAGLSANGTATATEVGFLAGAEAQASFTLDDLSVTR